MITKTEFVDSLTNEQREWFENYDWKRQIELSEAQDRANNAANDLSWHLNPEPGH